VVRVEVDVQHPLALAGEVLRRPRHVVEDAEAGPAVRHRVVLGALWREAHGDPALVHGVHQLHRAGEHVRRDGAEVRRMPCHSALLPSSVRRT
jgi:hypothetical protein